MENLGFKIRQAIVRFTMKYGRAMDQIRLRYSNKEITVPTFDNIWKYSRLRAFEDFLDFRYNMSKYTDKVVKFLFKAEKRFSKDDYSLIYYIPDFMWEIVEYSYWVFRVLVHYTRTMKFLISVRLSEK